MYKESGEVNEFFFCVTYIKVSCSQYVSSIWAPADSTKSSRTLIYLTGPLRLLYGPNL